MNKAVPLYLKLYILMGIEFLVRRGIISVSLKIRGDVI
jgi:hypothetical protein